ncbi:E3 ubiquitin-protein ligase RNF181-like [Ananas comosus]|uniref:E3 ubiquitin-protein ligase RNF181-like n=1 Tax=Ananas comosus TaxID=4615 RepID=A0A6P5G989_ANACO|nr:E3 ubiquitin-protein ligase RNF181-like [Ananas comosus]
MMILPVVDFARKRRLQNNHNHNHPADPSASHASALALRPTSMDEPAIAARIRLEEKLRGHPSTRRTSRFLLRDGGGVESSRPPPPPPVATNNTSQRVVAGKGNSNPRFALSRTASRVDVCAVCLEEVATASNAQKKVTRLPCSHKFHSDCVLPWLASHPDCPCCRTPVPSLSALS